MELHQLRYAVMVAETLNFGSAAKRLHVSQPPISRAVQSLEAELGVKLFNRTHRQVELTEAGRRFIADARDILVRLEASARHARSAAEGDEGRLVIGFEGSSAFDLIPRALKSHRDRFPAITFDLREMPTAQLVAALDQRMLDVAFVIAPFTAPGVTLEVLDEEPLYAALPAGHKLAATSAVELASLSSEAFVTSSQLHRCGIFEQVVAACRLAGFTPRVVAEVNEVQVMLGFVAAGLGVSIVARSATLLARPQVVYRPLRGAGIPGVSLALAWRERADLAMVDRFRETVQAVTNTDRIVKRHRL